MEKQCNKNYQEQDEKQPLSNEQYTHYQIRITGHGHIFLNDPQIFFYISSEGSSCNTCNVQFVEEITEYCLHNDDLQTFFAQSDKYACISSCNLKVSFLV
ncbi:hypothetical protein ABZP36_031951 [Zizania latifolia]